MKQSTNRHALTKIWDLMYPQQLVGKDYQGVERNHQVSLFYTLSIRNILFDVFWAHEFPHFEWIFDVTSEKAPQSHMRFFPESCKQSINFETLLTAFFEFLDLKSSKSFVKLFKSFWLIKELLKIIISFEADWTAKLKQNFKTNSPIKISSLNYAWSVR